MQDNADIRELPRAQSPGLGLGERLRSARKARALSVAQVAEALRLEEASVVALEDGRFDAMGAPVFVRGHLKRYAQLVGLSQEQVLDAYRAAVPDSDAPPSLARPREQTEAVRMGSWGLWLAAALLLAAIIIALSGGEGGESVPATAAPADAAMPAVPGAAPRGGVPAVETPGAAAAADLPAAPDGTSTAPPP